LGFSEIQRVIYSSDTNSIVPVKSLYRAGIPISRDLSTFLISNGIDSEMNKGVDINPVSNVINQ
jgi:hypothetical protein